MFTWVSAALAFIGLALAPATQATDVAELSGLGRLATPEEIAAWDIDVRPDFQGLPVGSGTAEDGEMIWLDKCASCHGDFGDSNEVFAPLVLGNVTEDDIAAGRVAALADPAAIRTTLMKVATLSTLWDYINRAMPWNAPKSLTADEVYALVAYLLNLGYIIDMDFVLSNETVDEVQAMMPNRNGMTREHGLWSVSGKPDVMGSACVSNCPVGTEITSSLPAYAMNDHGNLKDQVRSYGPMPGIQTAPNGEGASDGEGASRTTTAKAPAPSSLLTSNGCTGCHRMSGPLVGPGFSEISARYGADKVDYLVQKIRAGGSGVWGSTPMPAMAAVDDTTLITIARWLTAGN